MYVDNDDAFLEEYKTIFNKYSDIIYYIIGPKIGVPKAFNLLASKVNEEFIMMFNDDLEVQTLGWDKTFKNFVKDIKDHIFVAFFNDGINFDKHAAFPIISKKHWFDLVGYSSTDLIFQHNDTWIYSIGVMLKRTIYFDQIKLVHNHGYSTKEFQDKTFIYNRNKLKILKDHLIFLLLFPKRLYSYKILKKKTQPLRADIFEKKSKFKVELNNLLEILILSLKLFIGK